MKQPSEILPAKGKLQLDVCNTADEPIQLAFAVFTGDERHFTESETKEVYPGWNHVVFDLGAKSFKTEKTDWVHSTTIENRDAVTELTFLVYTRKTGALVIDGIGLDEEE